MPDHSSHNPFKGLSSHFGSREGKAKRLKHQKDSIAASTSASKDDFLSPPTSSRRRGNSSSRPESATDDELSSYQSSEAGSIAPPDDDAAKAEPEPGPSKAGGSFWEQAYQELSTKQETKSLMQDYNRVLAESKKEADVEDKEVDGNGDAAAAQSSGNGDGEEQHPAILSKESEMKDLVSKKLKKMQEKEWVIKWKGKEVFRVRKAVTETVKIVQKFSDLASAAASLDPLHAGLAWAGVSCLLPLLMNDTEERTKAVDGVSSTSQITARYLLIERDYRIGLLGKDDKFEGSAITLCSEILKFYAKAAVFFARNSWKKWLGNTFKIDDWTGALDAISEAEKACQAFSAVLTSSTLLQGRREISKLLAAHEKDQIHKMVAWVSATKVGQQHHQVREKLGGKYGGSGQWLLDLPTFVAWKATPHGHFWLRGAVGTGKSSLVSIVVEQFKDKTDNFAYFYCTNVLSVPDAKESPKCTVVRALAAQLVLSPDKESIAEEVKLEYEKSVSLELAGSEPGYEQSLDILSKLIASRDSTTIVIDALDECPDYLELLGGLKTLAEQNSNLKLFVSSQLVVPVSTYLELNSNTIRSDQNMEDIKSFIKGEMEKYESLRSGVLTDKLSHEILDTLSEKAGGMFKWVELCLKFLLDPSDEEDQAQIQENLDIIKKKPNQGVLRQMVEAYEKLYKKHLPSNPNKRAKAEIKAKKILAWVFASTRPLYLFEIMSLDRKDYIEKTEHQEGSEQDILKVCRTFLFVSENLKVVEMSHSSVSDYLALKFSGKLEDLLKDTKGQIDPDKLLQDSHDLSKVLVNATVAQESISYLLSTKDLKLGQDHTINPESLLSYTAEFWFQHVKVAIRLANKVTNDDQQNTLENVLKTLRDSIRALLDPQNQGAFENWLAIHDPDEVERIKGKDHTSGDPRGQQLYYAMFLGLWVVARDMIDDGWDVNIIGGYFGTCLQLASYRGNEPTVSKLLEKHASMNVEAGIFGSALQAAAAQGHTSICSLLLNNGADVNISCGLLCNPLQAALTRRSKATIELLTDRIVQVDANSGKVAKALMISRELQESSAKSQPTWISNPHCHDIVTKVSDSDKNDEWYLYNQLPLVGLCSMMKLFTNQRSVKNVDSQALEIMARIISEHGDFLARQIMLQTDFKASPLAEILTRIYEDIFKIQFHTLRRSHMVSSKRIVNIFRSLYLPRKDGASLETIMAMDERAKQIEQLVEVAELNSLMRHPLSDQLREFIEKQAEQAEQAANIANVQRSADPGTSEQFKTSSQTAQCITGNPLQTNQLTIEACELSQDESQKISEQLWAGTETGVILASKPEGQAALENVKRNVFRRMPGVLQIEPQASKAGDNTTSAQEKVDEEDDTSADNTPYKEEEVQETKSLTREDTRAPPGNADEEDDASVVKAPPREEEVQETKPLIREDAVTTQEEVDKEDDPKSEDEPKDVEVREMKSLAREDTVAAEKKVDEEDDTSAEKNPPKEAEVQEKPLTREQELSAGLAYVKEEMSQLRKEVKELRGLVQKMTKVLEHKDLLKASESDKFSDE